MTHRLHFLVLIACIFIAPCCIAQYNSSDKDITITVDPSNEGAAISPLLMGFNNVYCFEPDQYWQNGDGIIPQHLKKLNTGIMRYPGGTVVTRYQWENPSGQGWTEAGESTYRASNNTSPSEFMDIDEYLTYTKKLGIEPLVGINMSTGIKYNKIDEYVAMAQRLVRHCLNSGIKVKYYYLDNEPYIKDISYKFTAKTYAEQINIYATAIKKIDPNIKIIANTYPAQLVYTDTLMQIAGSNIDIFDIHYYWYHGRASFENWTKQERMIRPSIGSLGEQRIKIKELAKKYGRPDIEMVALEWNVGPVGDKSNGNRSHSQIALMVAEQYMDVLSSGMPFACFWPVSWPKPMDRALLDAQNGYKPNAVYYMFDMFKDVLGNPLISLSSSANRFPGIAAKSSDGKHIWVYVINKTNETNEKNIELDIKGIKYKNIEASYFSTEGQSTSEELNIKNLSIQPTESTIRFKLPQYALAKIKINL